MKDINLMPEEVKPAIHKRDVTQEKNISTKAILILLLVLIVVVATILSPKIYVKSLEANVASIKADIESDKYTEVKSINKQISSLQATLDLKKIVINTINENEVQILDILNYIQEAAPKGLLISGIQYGNKSLSITGTAKDSTAIAEYMSNITRLSVLKDFTSNASFGYGKSNAMLTYSLTFTQN